MYDDIRAQARHNNHSEAVDQPDHLPEAVPADEDEKGGWFEFISGLPGHEVQYNVRMLRIGA